MPLPLAVDGQLDGLAHDTRWSNETIDTYADEIADALEAVTQAMLDLLKA